MANNFLVNSSKGDGEKPTGTDTKADIFEGQLNSEENPRCKLAKVDLGATAEEFQRKVEENGIQLESTTNLPCPEGETLEMPVLLPHYASKEFRKQKSRKKKSRYPVLVNVKTKESVGKTKQVWCMICD